MSTTKGTEETKEHDVVETKVETVDYITSAGHEEEPPKKENIEVIHCTDEEHKDPGMLANAAAAVTDTIQSAKDKATSITSKIGNKK